MTQFYDISHNTAYSKGMPEIEEISEGRIDLGKCPECSGFRLYPSGGLRVRLGNDHATMWPDVIGCGSYPCFVVSARFVRAMEKNGIRHILGGTVDFVEPVENGLLLEDALQYFSIDGERHFAAKMDFSDLHVFPYSIRPGTSAAHLSGQVGEVKKRERTGEMLELAVTAAREYRLGVLGQTRPVLWESAKRQDSSGVWSGLTDNYLRVRTQSGRDLANTITDTRLTALDGDRVTGEVV